MFHGAAFAALAASVLAPAGTATIQAYPVCLPSTVQPGHSYPLTVYVSGGSMTLAVTPAHDTLERSLHQVPSSWVRFSSNPAGPGEVSFTLNIATDAEPGPYWSDIKGTTQGQAQAGAGAQAELGTAGTAALVFTVGPSKTPPPPCAALDLGYSTGKFPAWPTAAFATTSWAQVGAEAQRDNPKPITSPTAGSSPQPADPVPASPVSYSTPPGVSTNWPGWLIVGGIGLFLLYRLLKFLRIIR